MLTYRESHRVFVCIQTYNAFLLDAPRACYFVVNEQTTPRIERELLDPVFCIGLNAKSLNSLNLSSNGFGLTRLFRAGITDSGTCCVEVSLIVCIQCLLLEGPRA